MGLGLSISYGLIQSFGGEHPGPQPAPAAARNSPSNCRRPAGEVAA